MPAIKTHLTNCLAGDSHRKLGVKQMSARAVGSIGKYAEVTAIRYAGMPLPAGSLRSVSGGCDIMSGLGIPQRLFRQGVTILRLDTLPSSIVHYL